MATVERFQDLVAWQKARVLTAEIYAVTRLGEFSTDSALRNQIRRASVSVMANLAEGFERRRRTEFFRFVEIAKASCAEVYSHLYVALDVGFLTADEFGALALRVDELQRVLGGLRKALAPAAKPTNPSTPSSGSRARTSGLGPQTSGLGPQTP